MTHPTHGFGLVIQRTLAAAAIARAMHSRSIEEKCSDIALHAIRGLVAFQTVGPISASGRVRLVFAGHQTQRVGNNLDDCLKHLYRTCR